MYAHEPNSSSNTQRLLKVTRALPVSLFVLDTPLKVRGVINIYHSLCHKCQTFAAADTWPKQHGTDQNLPLYLIWICLPFVVLRALLRDRNVSTPKSYSAELLESAEVLLSRWR